MGSLFGVPVRELNAPRIDAWLDEMKDPNHKWIHSKKRKRFKNELKLLSTILGYYEEYYDDQGFRFPIKRRHYEDADLNRQVRVSKDLSLEEFTLFREALRKTPHGNVLSALATVQYFQAQRISETAGLFREDINLNEEKPSNSRLTVRRIIVWPRVRTTPSYIKMGFKNAEASDGIKEQPVFPEAYQALRELGSENKKGLVFQIDGRQIEYRLIQFWYDKSFKLAGLPYRGTHPSALGSTGPLNAGNEEEPKILRYSEERPSCGGGSSRPSRRALNRASFGSGSSPFSLLTTDETNRNNRTIIVSIEYRRVIESMVPPPGIHILGECNKYAVDYRG
jgi:hypothetical protein